MPRVARWRAALVSPAAAAIALYALTAAATAVAAYLIVFTDWQPYDDEGTLLVTLQSFVHGGTLYRDIYSEYGPFYYELFGGFFAIWGHPITTDVSRSIVLVLWVATSLAFGVASQRLTDRLLLGVAGMIAAFGALYVLANEPMHPQVLCVALLGAFVLLATIGPTRRPVWAGAAAGALLAALLMTKVNLGIFGVVAIALAAAFTVEPLRRRRWVRWPVAAAAVALPLSVAAHDLNLGWVRELVFVETLAMAAVVVAAWPLSSRGTLGRDDGIGRWVCGAVFGFAFAFAGILVAIVAHGTPISDVYEGMVTEAMRTRDINLGQFPMSPAVVDWAMVAFAGAVLSLRLRAARGGTPSIWPGVLRAFAGLAIWCTVAGITPFSLGPAAGNPDSLPMVLAWIAAIPPQASHELPYKRFLRILLPALAVAEALQVYPVPGSQMGIAALVFVPVGALCLADALVSLREWSAARGPLAKERLGIVLAVALVALAVDFAIDAVLRTAANDLAVYNERKALPFPGATLLHPASTEYETYTRLVEDLHRYRCTGFVGLPNVNSLYLWSGIEPPPPDPPGIWPLAFDSSRQRRVVRELRASPRPCAIHNQGVMHPEPDLPLVNYLLKRFHAVDMAGSYEFMLPNSRVMAGRTGS